MSKIERVDVIKQLKKIYPGKRTRNLVNCLKKPTEILPKISRYKNLSS